MPLLFLQCKVFDADGERLPALPCFVQKLCEHLIGIPALAGRPAADYRQHELRSTLAWIGLTHGDGEALDVACRNDFGGTEPPVLAEQSHCLSFWQNLAEQSHRLSLCSQTATISWAEVERRGRPSNPIATPAWGWVGLRVTCKCRYKGGPRAVAEISRPCHEGYGMAIRRDSRAIFRGASARPGAALLCTILLLSRP